MIEIGDIVDVYFENIQYEKLLEVIGKPQATGDCWKFERLDYKGNKETIYIQNFSKMILRAKE